MKKFLVLCLLAVGLFAHRYPITAEYYFMSSCVNSTKTDPNKMIDYCACSLNKIENHYTFNQFLNNMQKNKKAFLNKLAKEIIPTCISELTKEYK